MAHDWQTAVTQPDELGESPFWHPDEQMLYWVDITGQQIHRLNTFMGSVESWAMPSEPGCIAPARLAGCKDSGAFVIALRDAIYGASQWGGALRRLTPALHKPDVTRFNDGKADPAGRFWVGTISSPRDAAEAQLFSLDARLPGPWALKRQAGNAIVANGLAWSPDASTMYWTDTTTHTIRAWDFNPDTANLTHERVFKRWSGKPAGWLPGDAGYGGRPDGAAVDVQGNYWVAMFEGARVLQISPAGDVLADIAVPARCPTMPCFGGADFKTLFLTTARHGRSAAELAVYPDSGCVFSMRVDVPGLAVNFFVE